MEAEKDVPGPGPHAGGWMRWAAAPVGAPLSGAAAGRVLKTRVRACAPAASEAQRKSSKGIIKRQCPQGRGRASICRQ